MNNFISGGQAVFDFMPGFVAILDGPSHTFTYVNEAYRDVAGRRDFIGRTVQEVFPELEGQGFFGLLDEVYRTGTPYAARSTPIELDRDDGSRFIDFLYNPIRNDAGNITGIFVGGYDTTDARRAEERWRILANFSERLRLAESADDLPYEAAEVLGKALNVSRVGYGTIDDPAATLFVDKDFAQQGIVSLAGATPLLNYGSFIESLRRGEFVAIEDVRLDPRTSMAAEALESKSARSFVNVPVLERGKLVAVLFVNDADVRHWRADELELIKEVAERTRTALERERDIKARQLTESRYRTLFDAIDVGFCIIELKFDADNRAIDYRLEEINPAFARQTALEDAAGKWVSEAAPGLERHWFDLYGSVAQTGEAIRFENFAGVLGDGRWYEVHAFSAGNLGANRVAVLFNDITARKVAEEQLRELNATLEASVIERTAERNQVWTLSQDMFARANLQGTMSAVSPGWTRVLGWQEAELLSRPYATFMHKEDMEPTLTALATMGETGQATRFQNRISTSDGEWKWIEWTVVPEADGQNFIAVGRDLSDVKAREGELAVAQEALRQSQKMEAVGQLTGGLAHDFNNIVAGISGSLEMMSTRLAQGRVSDIDRYLTGAAGAAKRAAGLTQRLLAFSRRQTLEPKPTNVNSLVNGMLDLINRSVGPEIHVDTASAAALWTTFVDAGQLESALLNLCINARDAMPDGGKLTIETSNTWMDERTAVQHAMAPGQYISLSVSDTGIGMSAEVIERAFDPFFTTKPIGQGTGLGLSMVYGFAGQSGGAVRIYSELGSGTTVCIYLPRHEGDVVADGVDTTAGEASRAESGETVLLVDDEPLVRMIAGEALEELGYHVIEAGEGATALKVLNSDQSIDLLVTDVGLPGRINGRQLADAARVARRELKVLFITGYAENAVLNHGHLDPGMHVLTKPFQMEVFARRVKQLISGKS
ncbi:PAS domain-containing protein [Devosia sp. SL43]|uniref:PAS domain-containing protein n=1 Tax=Devosia sp. SL43 TaxID=2806348 RepID=UPI001F46B4CE|nr:PAS domain-containing protein [Devosia sp. SL43]UJW86484.1 PAS domain-containing protein [Devosia sp. SL43]